MTVEALAALVFVTAALAESAKPALTSERISVFKVPLVCPAAPNIGCGSRAKPILVQLEKQDAIAEAWLNREGTLLAIVWKRGTKQKARKSSFDSVMKQNDLTAQPVTGAERKGVLSDFQSGKEWLRGSDVDRLSEEEAGVMARRLIQKIRTIVTLADDKAAALQDQITRIIKLRLTGEMPETRSPKEEITKLLHEQLSEREAKLLGEALKDYRPNRDEP